MNSIERKEARYQRRKAKREAKRKAVLEQYGGFYHAVNRDALAKAAREATKGVRYKASVKRFMLREITNVADLSQKLERGKDVHKGFICFYVVERGKLRLIMSVHFSERVVQKAINQNALIPVLTRSLIYDNSASQKGKGTHFAIRRTVTHLRRYYRRYGNDGYVLQIDLKNYFGSIDHEISKDMVRQAFEDEQVVNLICRFIDSYYEHYIKEARRTGKNIADVEAKGLGLGSEINQTIAVAFLDRLDHFIKEVLQIKAYERYNDDFYLIHPDKEYLKYCLEMVRIMCGKVKVEPNERKTHIVKLSHGFTFLKTQFFLTETGKVVRKPCRKSIARERRKLKKQKRLVDAGLMKFADVRCSFVSWRSSIEKKQARRSIWNMSRLFDRLFIEDWFNQISGGTYDEGYGQAEYRKRDQQV